MLEDPTLNITPPLGSRVQTSPSRCTYPGTPHSNSASLFTVKTASLDSYIPSTFLQIAAKYRTPTMTTTETSTAIAAAPSQTTMAPRPELTLIVAATSKMGIGLKGTLPWTGLKKEMAYFARVTKRTGGGSGGVCFVLFSLRAPFQNRG